MGGKIQFVKMSLFDEFGGPFEMGKKGPKLNGQNGLLNGQNVTMLAIETFFWQVGSVLQKKDKKLLAGVFKKF